MRKWQQGQVLPLGLALLAFGVLSVFVLYNTGQSASDKTRLANTADAAAYSGILWQARALNFQSYTNRAMVANQVSIAQAVTLRSWAAYGAIASENLATVLKPVPVLNAVASGLEAGLTAVESVIGPVSKGIVSVVDVVNRGLSVAQEAVFAGAFAATPDVIKTVVATTDERFIVETGFSIVGLQGNLSQWTDFTTGYASDDVAAMTERQALINQSRDGFTQDRNWKFFDFWFYSTPLTRHRIYREGDTQLSMLPGKEGIDWEWKAKDTMSLHNRLWTWKGTKRWEVPIGWAEAFVNTRGSSRTLELDACTSDLEMVTGNCNRFLQMNRRAEYLADTGVPSPVKQTQSRLAMQGYSGVHAFRSLSKSAINDGSPVLKLKVEVALPEAQVKSSAALTSGNRFKASAIVPGNILSSISVAEVFYKRPDADQRDANAMELANGYNPYWDTRLGAVSKSDRLLALALRSGGSSTSVPAGASTPEALASYPDANIAATDNHLQATSTVNNSGNTSELSMFADMVPLATSFDNVAMLFSRSDAGDLKAAIEKELNEAMKDALKRMLRGAVSGSALSSGTDAFSTVSTLVDEVKRASEEAVSDLATAEALLPFRDAIAEAERIARELEAEFIRIRAEIISEFTTARSEVENDIASGVFTIEQKIQAVQVRIESAATNEEAERDLEKTIRSYQADIRDLENSVEEMLVQKLIEIVDAATDMYVMSVAEARYLVRELLNETTDWIKLPWTEVVSED